METKERKFTCWTGAFFRGPPGLGGESLGLSPVGSQSFLTGAGNGVENVAIVTSPNVFNEHNKNDVNNLCKIIFSNSYR